MVQCENIAYRRMFFTATAQIGPMEIYDKKHHFLGIETHNRFISGIRTPDGYFRKSADQPETQRLLGGKIAELEKRSLYMREQEYNSRGNPIRYPSMFRFDYCPDKACGRFTYLGRQDPDGYLIFKKQRYIAQFQWG